ncbi:MAG: tRNA-uridine aminocarboxypropyltransferase [Pigmentiphaga sp.]
MRTPPKPPRSCCERCLRPMSHCLCAHIPAVSNRTRVVVLQHPDEAKHPLNTARLAVLGLRRAELWIGEHFPQLEDAIVSVERALLLFPTKEESPPATHGGDGALLLIVPDGTWRKARKIVRANPVLNTLPCLSLPAGEPSEYRVRKASELAAVSTIEAIVRALTTLEPQQDFQSLLRPFQVLVEQQVQAMGEEVYQRNYASR